MLLNVRPMKSDSACSVFDGHKRDAVVQWLGLGMCWRSGTALCTVHFKDNCSLLSKGKAKFI